MTVDGRENTTVPGVPPLKFLPSHQDDWDNGKIVRSHRYLVSLKVADLLS